MPRVAFTPDPISFANDPAERVMGPLRQNLMGLVDTFATEVPQIRMRQEAADEDKRRYETELGMKMEDRKIAAEGRAAKAKADRTAQIKAAGEGFYGSIQPNMTMSVGRTGATMKQGKAGAVSAASDPYDTEVANYQSDTKRRQDFRAKAALENVGTASEPRRLSAKELDDLEIQTFGPRGVLPVREGDPTGISEVAFGGNEYPEGGEAGGRGLSMTMPDGTPRMSQPQLELALAQFEQIKRIPAEERAALGYTDERLYEAYKLLQRHMGVPVEGEAAPAAPAAPVAEAPTQPDAAPVAPTATPVAPVAPVARASTPQDEQTTLQKGLQLYQRLALDVMNGIGKTDAVLQLKRLGEALTAKGVKLPATHPSVMTPLQNPQQRYEAMIMHRAGAGVPLGGVDGSIPVQPPRRLVAPSL